MTGYIFIAVLLLIAAAASALISRQHKKRGCGRGCSTCGNRFICHPEQYKK